MKLIIECTELTYSECKKISGLSETAFVIANGKPYDDSGDLISRSALREALKELHTRAFEIEDEFFEFGLLIDNAQAVDLWQMRQEATENALKKAEVLYARPQGEWQGGELGHCTKCGHKGSASDIWSGCDGMFCPNCGANLKGGAE